MAWDDPEPELVADGVHRLPLPIPGNSLKAVNVYAIEGADRVTLIDAGWHDSGTMRVLRELLGRVGHRMEDVGHVVVTHLHGDHYGQAGRLREITGATVYLGEAERLALGHARAGFVNRMQQRDDYLRRAGAQELLEDLHREVHEPLDLGWEPPDAWLDGGETVVVSGRELHAIHTPGHTRGHLSFIDGERRLLFSGDHVLPHITPSVGFELPGKPTALDAFLHSLGRVRNLDVDLVLPAHGPTFVDLTGRVDELLAHHDDRLANTARALSWQTPRTPYQVAQELVWTRRETAFKDLDAFGRMLAVWETFAHLQLLAMRGDATRHDATSAQFWSSSPVPRQR